MFMYLCTFYLHLLQPQSVIKICLSPKNKNTGILYSKFEQKYNWEKFEQRIFFKKMSIKLLKNGQN